MAISEADVRKVAMLARLSLSDEDVAMFARQLGDILDYVHKLNELDVEGVEPMAHAVDISNVFRRDEAVESPGSDRVLANAPKRRRGFFLVPKVLEQSSS